MAETTYKNTRWAQQIIALQKENGAWGYFHTLSEPKKYPVTTEMALRRLGILCYTIADAPVKKAVAYLTDCLDRKQRIPDRFEQVHNRDNFCDLMFATWVRTFTKENRAANRMASMWAVIVTDAFTGGAYDHQKYMQSYTRVFGMKPKGARLLYFTSFYQVSLLAGELDAKTEEPMFDYILHKPGGMYYIPAMPGGLAVLPAEFTSRLASRYLAVMEILSGYRCSAAKLKFVVDWLESNRNENGKWDMGPSVNDKIYFPLSDSWRQKETRELDCTYRINKLLAALKQ